MLESLGCLVDVAADGREVLDALALTSYDLILMDCQMPGMDGYDATKLIRERKSTIPIIAVTAHVMQRDYEQCLATGMDDYLSKPFSRDQLRAVLERWLPRSPGTGAAGGAECDRT